MSKNGYTATKLRCKQALDLLGDALLQDAITDIDWVERMLCRALEFGSVARQLPGPQKGRLAETLIRESKKKQALEQLVQARATLKGGRS